MITCTITRAAALVFLLVLASCNTHRATNTLPAKQDVETDVSETVFKVTFHSVQYVADFGNPYVALVISSTSERPLGNNSVEYTTVRMNVVDHGDSRTSARERFDSFYVRALNKTGFMSVFVKPKGVADEVNQACFDCSELPR